MSNPTPTQQETLLPCPLGHHVSAGLRVNKADPKILCLDCGLTLAATDWTTLYERWNRRAAVPTMRSERLRRYQDALEQIRDSLFRYSMGDYETCAKNAARMALEHVYEIVNDAATSSSTPSLRNLLGQFLFDKYGCTLEHHRMKVLKHFIEWAETESAAAPAERTEVEGEQESAVKTIDWLGDMEVRRIGPLEAQNRDKAQEIILATEAALGEKFDSIARHELVNRITIALTAVAPADNNTESLLSKITTIADIGSAEEFGDALERLKLIRQLIDTTTKGDR